jgi:hypothetical protein
MWWRLWRRCCQRGTGDTLLLPSCAAIIQMTSYPRQHLTALSKLNVGRVIAPNGGRIRCERMIWWHHKETSCGQCSGFCKFVASSL